MLALQGRQEVGLSSHFQVTPKAGGDLSGQTRLPGRPDCFPCERRARPPSGPDRTKPCAPHPFRELLLTSACCPHSLLPASATCHGLWPHYSQLGPEAPLSPPGRSLLGLPVERQNVFQTEVPGPSSTCWSRGLSAQPRDPSGPGGGTATRLLPGLNHSPVVWVCRSARLRDAGVGKCPTMQRSPCAQPLAS